jgi:RsiW-degrading membrane proteinase PrsW (M82 family)
MCETWHPQDSAGQFCISRDLQGGIMTAENVLVKRVRRNAWVKVFFGGVGLYFLSLVIMVFTSNPNLFPTVVMIGNFLVPVTYVAFFYERRHLSQLTSPITASVFFYGGLLGVLASAVLEPFLVRPSDPLSVLVIGTIEEGVKIIGVMLIALRRRPMSEVDGLIMGAAVGMGFAALESMGYTFTEFLTSQGSLSATVITMLVRGIMSPFGHGTWTAILASVLFQESPGTHYRLTWRVLLAFVGVVLLHALWDGLSSIIGQIFNTSLAVLIAQTVVGIPGFIILWRRWHRARKQQSGEQ